MAIDAGALAAPIDVRPLLMPLRESLVDLLSGLDGDDWATPTTPGWTVLDTAAHLLGDDLARLARTRDSYRGVVPSDEESLPAFLDRVNHEWVVAARRLSPRLLTELLIFTGTRVREQWAGRELDEPSEAVTWSGVDPAPVWLDMARDYTEYWVHQAQVREAVEQPLLDEERFVSPLVHTFLQALPFALDGVLPEEGEPVLTVDVTDLAPGDWHLRADQDGHWSFLPAVEPGGTTVAWTSDTVWRLGCRMIDPATARARAHVDGDMQVAKAVCGLLAVIREPD